MFFFEDEKICKDLLDIVQVDPANIFVRETRTCPLQLFADILKRSVNLLHQNLHKKFI